MSSHSVRNIFRKAISLTMIQVFGLSYLLAHHKGTDHGNAGGNGGGGGGGGEVPEIDGSELTLAILALGCVWVLFSQLRKTKNV